MGYATPRTTPTVIQTARGLIDGRPFGIVTVTEFGAVGDGVTNDSVAIQAALDAVDAAGGGTVVFPPGVFAVGRKTPDDTTYMSVPSKIRIIGAGRGATTLRVMDDAPSGHNIFQIEGVEDINIAHLTIDGNKQRLAPEVVGADENECIHITVDGSTRSKNIHIHDVHIHDAGADAIDSDGSDGLTVTDCILEDNGGLGIHAVGAARTNDVVVRGTVFRRNALARAINGGIAAADACAFDSRGRNVTVSGCIFVGNYKGVAFRTDSGHTLSNCIFKDQVSYAVDFNGGSDHVMTGCDLRSDSTVTLVYIGAAKFTVQGNNFTSAGNNIIINGGYRGLISGNQFNAGVAVRHELTGDATWPILISDNNYRGGANGINIRRASGGGLVILNNHFFASSGSATAAIDVSGTGAAVPNVKVQSNSAVGFPNGVRMLTADAATDWTIFGNDFGSGAITTTGTGHVINSNVVAGAYAA